MSIKYDIFFLSYDELNADLNWLHLKELQPHAQRVHGIKGLKNAHQECANRSKTDNFFVVDGDCWIYPDFDFTVPDYVPSIRNSICLWFSRNAVNDLAYGNGGVKIFPKYEVKQVLNEGLDFTMEITKSYMLHHHL